MRTRHRPPSLVSMWMLDVFCCALGCVTLLWLVNTRIAGEEARKATSTQTELTSTQEQLLAVQQDLENTTARLNAQIDDLQARLLAVTRERDDTARQLAVAKAETSEVAKKLARSTTTNQALEELLRKKQTEAADLTTRLATSSVSIEELQKLLRERTRERDDLTLQAKAAEEQLNDVDAKLRALAKTAEDAKAQAAAMAKSGNELAAAKARMADLQKQLDNANVNIIDLQGEKQKLADRYDRLRIDSENKFAGIALTGKRVAFVVDISGSMKLRDERTPDPTKWPMVVDTVVRVIRSVPDLEMYQVIIFSRKAQYLFGEGEWRPYQGEASVNEVSQALRALEPVGDTNVYDGFDLAFRLKRTGLDTIYLFSDGLPTSGQGLTLDQERTFTESQRTEALSRHLREKLLTEWNPRSGRRVKINAIGFFYESPEIGSFLWVLAREHDGSFVGMSRP